ncbi:unnamed protein product [Alternaria alternata]
MQSDVVQPIKAAAAAANQTHDGNESPSSGSKATTPRISRFFPILKSPGELSVSGHRKTQSEDIARHEATINFESRTPLRRNRSVVDSLALGVKKEQQILQESEATNTRSQGPEETGKPIHNPVFDPSRLDHLLRIALKIDFSTGGKFIPRGDLDRLVTQELVNRELSRKESFATKILRRPWLSSNKYVRVDSSMEHEHTRCRQAGLTGDTMTTFDGPSYRKIFAILVFMGRQRKIRAFVKEQVCDSDLPLESKNFELRRRGNVQSALKCFKEPSDIEQFVTYQWWVLARDFHKTNEGAPNNVVAVKKICVNNPEAFHELNVLQNLRKTRHVHHNLLTLIATYEQHDFLFLILPWAEADLDQFWRLKDPTMLGKSIELSNWLTQQCCGIAAAVSQIHRYKTTSGTTMLSEITSLKPKAKSAQRRPHLNQWPGSPKDKILFGRHGDIKPANILWFPETLSEKCFGTLKLSDFGTAHFSVEERTSIQDRYAVPYSRSYRSPECQLPDGELSSQCDVWALGCVFLEFVCWYVGGGKLLDEFERERLRAGGYEGSSFFFFKPGDSPQNDALGLKAPVIKMIETLHESLKVESASNMPLRDILRTVKDDMLVISYDGAGDGSRLDRTGKSSSLNFLGVKQTRSHRRKSAGNIARELGSILESPEEMSQRGYADLHGQNSFS